MPASPMPTATPRVHCGATPHEAPRSSAAPHLREAAAPRANVVARAEGIAPIIDSTCSLQTQGLAVPSLHRLLRVLLLVLAGLLEVCGLVLLIKMPASCAPAACMPTSPMPTATPRVHCGATPHEAPRSSAAPHLRETTAPGANMVTRAEGIAPIINSTCRLQT